MWVSTVMHDDVTSCGYILLMLDVGWVQRSWRTWAWLCFPVQLGLVA